MKTALTLGALGVSAARSGITWLRENGSSCRAGEALGFCALALDAASLRGHGGAFADEELIQVVFASPVAGRLEIDPRACGRPLDDVVFETWNADDIVCRMLGDGAGDPTSAPLRHLMLAGRRIGWPADAAVGPLAGLHSRARAWWGDEVGQAPTLLAFGLCDATGFVRGRQYSFIEWFEASRLPGHLVHSWEKPLTPCAPLMLDQLSRTAEQSREIALDLGRSLADSRVPARPADLVMAGALLQQLEDSPLLDRHAVFDRGGIVMARPPEVVLMSVSAEPRSMLRHKRLGYRIDLLPHNLRTAGPAMRNWIANAFEPVRRSLADIHDDYARLADAALAVGDARLLIVNRMSTSGREDILNYAAFDAPLGESLVYVAGKEVNLMLHDLADAGKVDILDVDAIAAEIGGARHLVDGIHQSADLQAVLRSQVVGLLASIGQGASTLVNPA
ncbi:hypothetical protein BH10PSE17_BH10PSE17_25560 [soil metagenome]